MVKNVEVLELVLHGALQKCMMLRVPVTMDPIPSSLHPFVELAFWDELLLARKKMTPSKSPKRVANDAKENMEHLDSVLGCHLHSGAPGKKRGQLVSAEELWYQMQSNIMQPFSSLGFLGISWFRQLQTEKERNEIKEVELQKQETLSCRHSFSHLVGRLLPWEGHIWMILHASSTILWNFLLKKFKPGIFEQWLQESPSRIFRHSWIEMDSCQLFFFVEGGDVSIFSQASFKTPKGCRTPCPSISRTASTSNWKRLRRWWRGWSNKSHKGRCVCNHGSVDFLFYFFWGVFFWLMIQIMDCKWI